VAHDSREHATLVPKTVSVTWKFPRREDRLNCRNISITLKAPQSAKA